MWRARLDLMLPKRKMFMQLPTTNPSGMAMGWGENNRSAI